MSEEVYTPKQFARSLLLRGYTFEAQAEEYIKLFPKDIYFESDLEEAYRYYNDRTKPQWDYELPTLQTRSSMAYYEYCFGKRLNKIAYEAIRTSRKLKDKDSQKNEG